MYTCALIREVIERIIRGPEETVLPPCQSGAKCTGQAKTGRSFNLAVLESFLLTNGGRALALPIGLLSLERRHRGMDRPAVPPLA